MQTFKMMLPTVIDFRQIIWVGMIINKMTERNNDNFGVKITAIFADFGIWQYFFFFFKELAVLTA